MYFSGLSLPLKIHNGFFNRKGFPSINVMVICYKLYKNINCKRILIILISLNPCGEDWPHMHELSMIILDNKFTKPI